MFRVVARRAEGLSNLASSYVKELKSITSFHFANFPISIIGFAELVPRELKVINDYASFCAFVSANSAAERVNSIDFSY